MLDPRWPPLNDMTQFLRHRMSPAHAVDLIRCHTFNIQRVRGGGGQSARPLVIEDLEMFSPYLSATRSKRIFSCVEKLSQLL